MITISWLIERLLVKPTEGTLTDVVINADWRCNGTDETYSGSEDTEKTYSGSEDTEKTYSGTCYGSCSFAAPAANFTPYPDLTQEQVLDWCYANGVDQAAIEANVTLQIENQINPPVVTLPLPWVPVIVAEPVVVADAPAV